jgi:hypothetical protein
MAGYHNLSKYGPQFRASIWDKTHGICWYCGTQTNPWVDFCIDHVENYGTDEKSNLVSCCRTCNRLKSNKTLEDFRKVFFEKHQRDFWCITSAPRTTDAFCTEECKVRERTENSIDAVKAFSPYFDDRIMLTLFSIAYIENADIPMLDDIAKYTHQSPHVVLAHLFRLHDDGVISLQWDDVMQAHCCFTLDLEERALRIFREERSHE